MINIKYQMTNDKVRSTGFLKAFTQNRVPKNFIICHLSPDYLRYLGGKLFIICNFFLSSMLWAQPDYDNQVIDTLPVESQSGPFMFDIIEIHRLVDNNDVHDDHRSESADFADFNGDGLTDILCGAYWYEAPDWTPHKFREYTTDGNNYFANLSEFGEVLHLNGDNYPDVVQGGTTGRPTNTEGLTYFINPGPGSDEFWESFQFDKNRNYHGGNLWDVNGDGDTLEIMATGGFNEFPISETPMSWWSFDTSKTGAEKFTEHIIGNHEDQFGSGLGDVNMDGRPDVVRANRWYEMPENMMDTGWAVHDLAMGGKVDGREQAHHYEGNNHLGDNSHMVNLYVYDVNQDGLNDIMGAVAHGFGVMWYEQVPVAEGEERIFVRHVIDQSWANPHNLEFRDVDGDGDPDLISGKRMQAAGGIEDTYDFPIGIFWYELRPGEEIPWIRHTITWGDDISINMNIGVMDYDFDGDADIVVTNYKTGVFLLVNRQDPVRVKLANRPVANNNAILKVWAGNKLGIQIPGKGLRDVRGAKIRNLIPDKLE